MATIIDPDVSSILLRPGMGERLRIFDEEFFVQFTGEATAGAYALATGSVAPGGGPPLHTHPGPETVYVLTGEFEFTQRDASDVSTIRGGPGTVFHAPGGAPHRFENVSPTRSALLTIIAPESVDMLRELATAFPPGSPSDIEKMLAIHSKYQVELIYGEAGSRPEPPRDGAPSARARALAWRLSQASDALIATLEACPAERWRAICEDTGWTVGVQVHHIGSGEPPILSMIQDVANLRPHPPTSLAKLDAINARHAQEFANVTKEEAVSLLRRNVAIAAELYRSLTDDQLERVAVVMEGHPPASVVHLIEYLAIGEIERHGGFIRTAIDQ